MYPRETTEGPVRVSGVGVWQAGLVGALGMLALSVVFVIAFVAGFSRMFAGSLPVSSLAGGLVGLGTVLLVALFVYPIMGFVGGAVTALLYNATGAITGGLEITVRE